MKTVTNETVESFENYLYEEEKSGNTIEKYMRDIRFFRRWLGDKELDKSVVLEYKKELTKAEYERLLAAAKIKNDEQLYMLMQEQKLIISYSTLGLTDRQAVTVTGN